jgi:tight adherence protein B
LRARKRSRFPFLDRLIGRLGFNERLGRDLRRGGVPLRVEEFFFAQLVAATLLAFVGLLALSNILGGLPGALLMAAVGFVLPLTWLRFRISSRRQKFEEMLADCLDLIAGSLRAGYGLEHGLDIVAREGSGPCAEEFGQLLQELTLGADFETALYRLADRVNSEEALLLVTAVSVQRRTGGNMVEVLSQMSGVIRERQRLRRDVRVITTAPRVSGYVVSLLPVITAGFMFIVSRYYIDTLLTSNYGRLALVVATCLVLLGLFLNNRIAKVDM